MPPAKDSYGRSPTNPRTPSIPVMTSETPDAHPYHKMEIYKDEAAIAALVARMIVQALQLQQPALVMTTPVIKGRIAEALERAGFDVQLLDTERKVHMIDEEVLREAI